MPTNAIEPPNAIELPEPCLVVLIGAAGSGKSTLAARLFAPAAILSSDAFRAMVSGNASDQGATRAAFRILHAQVDRRLAKGRTTVVDATNVTPFARRSLVRRATAQGVPAVTIVLDLDSELVVARNAARAGRVVPEPVVRRQLADLERSLGPGVLANEGFAAVHVVHTAAHLDSLQISRSTPPQ